MATKFIRRNILSPKVIKYCACDTDHKMSTIIQLKYIVGSLREFIVRGEINKSFIKG